MKRLFFSGLLVLAAIACDPDLEIIKADAGGVPEGGPGPSDPSDAGGNPSDATATEDAPSNVDGGVTHVIDGIDDFGPGEKFITSSAGYEGFVAWDATRLYLGMNGTDVGANDPNKWVLVYLGVAGKAGTATGLDYGGQQQPTLPFDAGYHLRWKTTNDYTNVQEWNGSAWVDANPALFPITLAKQGTFVEMSATRAALGNPTSVKVHMTMLIEGTGFWTYSALPSTSLTDGPDPNYTKYFEFDLASTAAPNTTTPKP